MKPLIKIVRIVAMFALVLLGLVVAFCLLWLARNLFDEQLTPAATALLASRPDSLPAKDNLFVAFVGFTAPSGKSMMEVGEARIEAYNRAVDRMWTDPAAARTFDSGTDAKLTFKGSTQLLWHWLTSSIWSTAKTHRAEIAALTAANRELYQRYLNLHELHGYFDSARPSASTPLAYVPTDVQVLFLTDAAVRLQTGTPEQKGAAVADLQADILMWKAVLDGYGGFFSKLIAAISLHADFLLLGDMVTDPDFNPAPFGDRWTTLLTPFDLQDWKMGAAYPWQMRDTVPIFKAITRADAPLLAPDAPPESGELRMEDKVTVHFFKLNATENLEALRIERLRALADGDPGSFIERRTAYRVWESRHYPALSSESWYNPVGRILLALEPFNDDYPARLFDVAALQRLVFLAYQIRVRCIAASDVATFMSQHPEWATHPVGAKPFYWDPGSDELGVRPVGKNTQKTRFSLKLVEFSHCPRN